MTLQIKDWCAVPESYRKIALTPKDASEGRESASGEGGGSKLDDKRKAGQQIPPNWERSRLEGGPNVCGSASRERCYRDAFVPNPEPATQTSRLRCGPSVESGARQLPGENKSGALGS